MLPGVLCGAKLFITFGENSRWECNDPLKLKLLFCQPKLSLAVAPVLYSSTHDGGEFWALGFELLDRKDVSSC